MSRDSSVQSDLDALLNAGRSRVDATNAVIERIAREARQAGTVVLVEGLSDEIAVEVLAERQGTDLRAEGTFVVPTGGFTNFGRFLTMFGHLGRDVRLLGLYDSPVADRVRRSLTRAGIVRANEPLGEVGFHACVTDLEDEMIRSLGPHRAEDIVAAEGELQSLRRLQEMPFHRDRSLTDQLHRFIGSRAGRKYRYARALASALDLGGLPTPLNRLFEQL